MESRRLGPREASVQFRAAAVESRGEYRRQLARQVITLENIKIGEELFENYDIKYWLERSSI